MARTTAAAIHHAVPEEEQPAHTENERCLYKTSNVKDYTIAATDGDVGNMEAL